MKNAYIRDSKMPAYLISGIAFHIVEIAVAIVFFDVLFSNTQNLAGWNFYQVLFLYGFGGFVVEINNGFTRGGIRKMASELVRTGEYDFYVTKPIDSMFLVSFSRPRVFDFITAIFYLGILGYALEKGNFELGFINIIWFLFLTIFSFILFYFLQALPIIPIFWTVKGFSLQFMMGRMSQFMKYPIGVFPRLIKIGLMTLFPIMAVSYLPVRTLFYPPEPEYIVYMVLVTFAFSVITKMLWQFGEKNYGSASS